MSGAHPSAPTNTATAIAAAPIHAGQNNRSRSSSPEALRQGKHRCDAHQEQQRQPDRHRQPVEVRRTHDGAAILERLDEQREDRAQQHDEREHGEDHVVREERALT